MYWEVLWYDCSNDNTDEIVAKYNDSRIIYITKTALLFFRSAFLLTKERRFVTIALITSNSYGR